MLKRFLWKLVGGRDLWISPPKAPKAPEGPPPMRLRTLDDVDRLIESSGHGAAREMVRAAALPTFAVLANGAASDAPGATRLGGLPDLPPGATWPRARDGERLLFLGQIDLGELAKVAPSVLPDAGLLSVFAGDLDGAERGAVFLTPPGAKLERLAPEAPARGKHSAMEALLPIGVRFEAGVTLPSTQDVLFGEAVLKAVTDADEDAFWYGWTPDQDGQVGQMLGHAMSSLDDVHALIAMAELGWPRKYNHLVWKTWEAWEEAKTMEHTLANGTRYRPWDAEDDEVVRWILSNRERIEAEVRQWQVLLRVDSNREMGLWINDADPIYVMIRSDDLAAGDFSRVRVVATQG